MTTIGITGHRPPGLGCSYDIPNPTYEKVYAALQSKFHELTPEKIISGMALGQGFWAYLNISIWESVLNVKKKLRN